LALGAAPAFLPAGYDWIAHTTSESGAQGVAGAWVARSGFLSFGLAVLALGRLARDSWWPSAVRLHMGFGVAMVATAAYSHRPWSADVPFDRVEDLLHSVAATGMGFAFAGGVLMRLGQRRTLRLPGTGLDLVAMLASVLLPVSMSAFPLWDGLLQRAMMLVAYAWYAREALRLRAPVT
jgi:hypothetical protein